MAVRTGNTRPVRPGRIPIEHAGPEDDRRLDCATVRYVTAYDNSHSVRGRHTCARVRREEVRARVRWNNEVVDSRRAGDMPSIMNKYVRRIQYGFERACASRCRKGFIRPDGRGLFLEHCVCDKKRSRRRPVQWLRPRRFRYVRVKSTVTRRGPSGWGTAADISRPSVQPPPPTA